MIESAVTIALVPQIQKGPWIFWYDLEKSMEKSAQLGFDAIELFTEDARAISPEKLQNLLSQYGLKLAAVGTGAGKVVHGWTLTHSDASIRSKSLEFIAEMMEFGASFNAPAIIGSMQGSFTPGIEEKQTMDWLSSGLKQLNEIAGNLGTKLIYEPLNRYETNLINTLGKAANYLDEHELTNTRLLADLFHMNIEETNLSDCISEHISHIGHVHFADSNRNPAGYGHTNFEPIASALKNGGYSGFLSAEAFPWPDPDLAAEQTIRTFNKYFK
jgi:sugar phosphate isomerase/epimerase